MTTAQHIAAIIAAFGGAYTVGAIAVMYWNIYNGQRKRKQMTDLTKIEKPYLFCTKEEQEGLKGLLSTPDALQHLGVDGKWEGLLCWDKDLTMHLTYRQNPNWQPPKLDVPDWFWEKVTFSWVFMDPNGYFYLCDMEPGKGARLLPRGWGIHSDAKKVRLDKVFNRMFKPHNFNPHNIPWDKSLTKRPEGRTHD
jgi:hypothetical protein